MSKIKLLWDVAESTRALADSLEELARGMEENQSVPQEIQPTRTDNDISIEGIRAVLAEKSGQGKTQGVKALLYKYDAGKLSGVKPEDYPAILEEAKKL